ncbi:glycosyltransferase [Aureibaculum marinum]|uniref:Glycosyltransferase n=1 Tax=Aureibaculum marinum TaxID=2487930 RepID=A0A3N4P2E9_9FLAO|nr:glycosyltransferase [Aureibaculum marinum]RPD98009.1 glycosyltransferase [Aureibaculum marinum]
MKILIVVESLRSGGKERRLLSLIKELLKSNYEIELIIMSKSIHYKEIFDLDINIHFFNRNIVKDIKILTKFNTLINTFKPDVVHCWDNIAAFHFGPICKIKGIPFVNSMITTAPPKLPKLSKRYFFNAISYPFSDVILTNSKAGLHSFSVPQKKGKVIYNGFDFSRKKVSKRPEKVREELQINNRKVVGMVASFTEKKDYQTFIEAGEIILKEFNNVVFIAIGSGPNLNTIKNKINPDNKESFLFLGRQQDVESIVNIFDIGVLSTFTEGISNSIMEYMVFEKPVVATGGGGTNELVINNKTGYHIESENSKLLAEKILFLLNNPDIGVSFGNKGAELIKSNFSIDRMINETKKLYNELI